MSNHLRAFFRKKIPKKEETQDYPDFLGFLARRFSSADPLSRSSDPLTSLEKQLKGGYSVRIKKGVKRMTLFRFLLAKAVYDDVDGLHLDEFVVMLELYYDLLDHRDPSFVKKYSNWLNHIGMFLNDYSKATQFPVRIIKTELTEQLYFDFLEPHLPSKLAYFGLRGNRDLRKSWTLVLNSELTPQRKFQKGVLGVGYRDKGTLKSPSEGSPSWQEVNHFVSNLERMILNGEFPKEYAPPWLLSEIERESVE